MRPFNFLIVLLFILAAAATATVSAHEQQHHQQHQKSGPPPTPPTRQHGLNRGHVRRNAAKFFGYFRRNPTEYLHNQTVLKEEFMHAHNWVRTEFKLPTLTWDEKLASFARQYLMQRYEDCKLAHSTANYGENLFWGKNLHWTPSDAVYYWYMEKQWYDFKTLKCTGNKDCEHFTQIVWRDSTRVGCALQHCHKHQMGMLIVCEYDPPGNFVDEHPLQKHA